MNARRAANFSPNKIAYCITEDERYTFRWSGTEGRLLLFEGMYPEEVRLLGDVSPDEADAILNAPGRKPEVASSRLEDWFWQAAYFIGCRLHLPGFHKNAPSESDDRSASDNWHMGLVL